MGRAKPSRIQNLISGVFLPVFSIFLIPLSLTAVLGCLIWDRLRGGPLNNGTEPYGGTTGEDTRGESRSGKREKGCVIISGGRMSKGLHLARAFKRAGWRVVGVEEQGWGDLCPMRFSSSIDEFYLLPPASESYTQYRDALIHIAQSQHATLFIPVSGAGSSVEDAKAAEKMSEATGGRCRTFIQDPGTMEDLHDKDRFMALVDRLGFTIPAGQMVTSIGAAIGFLKDFDINHNDNDKDKDGGGRDSSTGRTGSPEPRFILKCMGLDENRGDMTLFPIKGDDRDLGKTKRVLEGLRLKISKECPYVFQEFIPGPEWCTHASVIDGHLTSFVACPSNDMLMTYENGTEEPIGKRAEQWTRALLAKLARDDIDGVPRRLTGHFSFDFIISSRNGEMYPIECNARVHTAIILLPLSGIASCYTLDQPQSQLQSQSRPESRSQPARQGQGRSQHTPTVSTRTPTLRPLNDTIPRSWIYNDLIMRYLPRLIPSPYILGYMHPSLPATILPPSHDTIRPNEDLWRMRLDPSLVADDPIPFLVLWHLYWPSLLLIRWWQGKSWTRLNVSTGRIFEA